MCRTRPTSSDCARLRRFWPGASRSSERHERPPGIRPGPQRDRQAGIHRLLAELPRCRWPAARRAGGLSLSRSAQLPADRGGPVLRARFADQRSARPAREAQYHCRAWRVRVGKVVAGARRSRSQAQQYDTDPRARRRLVRGRVSAEARSGERAVRRDSCSAHHADPRRPPNRR